jgi:hypothetical protein
MTVKQVKVRTKWKHDLSPFFRIDHCIVKAFYNQHIFTLSLLSDLLWFEIQFANHLTSLKIGIYKMYLVIGGGTHE